MIEPGAPVLIKHLQRTIWRHEGRLRNQFGTNHISHHLLTKLILPVLESTLQSRVIVVSSIAHGTAPPAGIVFDMLKTDGESYGTWVRYGQTRLANILFTKELARHHPKISAVALHPGLINSELFDANERVNPWCSWMVKLGGPCVGCSNRP